MENCSAGEREDREEERTNYVSYHANEGGWKEWLLDIGVIILNNKNSNVTRNSHDSTFTKHHDYPSNDSGRSESTSVSDNEEEGSHGRWAESLVVKSNLNKSILSNEFDILIQAPENASHGAGDYFVKGAIFASHGFVLVSQVLKNNSDHSDNSNTESSECNGSTMIPSTPVNSCDQADATGSVSSSVEVPHAGHGSNDELLEANEESDDPEESKEEVPGNVKGLFIIGNRGDW